jgi:nicotinamidase-related amidase
VSAVIDFRSYVGASRGRLLVLVDLQENNVATAAEHQADLNRSLDNCMAAIRHAREFDIPIAFTRHVDGPGVAEEAPHSAWIAGFEPRRSDMVFEREQPSCYCNQLFESVVSQAGNFVIAGLCAEEACLATAIDASRRGHRVTFLSDASASRSRSNSNAGEVHVLATKAIELFADVASTNHWRLATSQRPLKGHRYG